MSRFDTLLAEYLRWLEHNSGSAVATVNKYGGYLERLARWYREPPRDPQLRPGAPGPAETTLEDLELFTGLVAHRAGLGPRSRKPLVAAVRSFFRWAHRRGHLAGNPAANLVYPEGGRRLPDPMTLESAEKLIMAPDLDDFIGVRDAAIIAVLVGTGIRASGLVRMNVSSLIWTSEKGVEWLDVKVLEKGGRERVVPVPPEAAVLVRAYMGHPELQDIDRDLPDGDRVMWVSTNWRACPEHEYRGEKRRISTRSVADMLEKYGNRAGVPKRHRHPHAFRHLYGTELAEAGVDLLVRQALMGHSDPKSTQVYTHLAVRKLREASARGNPIQRMRAPVLESARELARRRSGSQ